MASAQAHSATIDSSRAHASFTIHPRLPLPSQGRFESLSGALLVLPKQQWKVEVKVDARKLSFDGPQWLSNMARSESFLNAETHPNIQFISMPFNRVLLEDGGELRGQLFLRGLQKPVRFYVEKSACLQAGYSCDLTVHGSVKRRDFGMQAYRFSIKDNVDFEFRIRLLADPAP